MNNLFDMSRFSVEDKIPDTFEYYVNETAKMLKKPYFQTFKMMETWSVEKIKDRYYECSKKSCPAKVWYGMRKKDLGRKMSYE